MTRVGAAAGTVILSAAKDLPALGAESGPAGQAPAWQPRPPHLSEKILRCAQDDSSASSERTGGDDAKLRQAARQLTGVFAQQLFKAMRDTVPQGEGAVSGGSGEEMFTGMLDEHLAGADPHGGAAAAAFTRGLSDAVYRRLRAHAGIPAADATAGVTPPAPPASLGQPSIARPAAPGLPARR